MKSNAHDKAMQKALKEFEEAVKAARLAYRKKVSAIIKASNEKKAQAIKRSIIS